MEFIEQYVKDAFILIYFSNGNYLEKMHNQLIEQIYKSEHEIKWIDGNETIIINNKKYIIPKLPEIFINPKIMNIFV